MRGPRDIGKDRATRDKENKMIDEPDSGLNRSEQAFLAIRESIIDGSLVPGTHLVQEDLAAHLGVSRQPVQQSLARLKAEGFVVERGSRGLYVAELDPADTVARFQIRVALEQVAVREAALRAASNPRFANRLRREGNAMLEFGDAQIKAGRPVESVTQDIAFHSFLCNASNNPLLQSTLEVHWLYIRRVMVAVVRYGNRGPTVWREHREILDAVCAGHVDEAVARMTVHIYGSGGALQDSLGRMAQNDGAAMPAVVMQGNAPTGRAREPDH